MGDPAACIELREPCIDLGQEDEPLDRVVEGRVLRKILERLKYPLTSRWFRQDRILPRSVDSGGPCVSVDADRSRYSSHVDVRTT